jgi:dTDP-glucose 4,6-dehydratase
MTYHREFGTRTAIVRIFNTYGPRLQPGDGRVVSNFLMQAMDGKPLTMYGDGTQTRSFCYVDDEVRGLLALFDSDLTEPVNIGNPFEYTMLELADLVREVTASASETVFEPLPTDDPTRRRPDITRARELLGWQPCVELREGLAKTRDWYLEERASGRL